MKNEIKYFSMFTGVGGFELGFERAGDTQPSSTNRKGRQGRSRTSDKQEPLLHDRRISTLPDRTFKCVGFSEIDKFASQVLTHRFPGIRNYGDAVAIEPRKLPDFDLLCGGFPCQAFSIAGKRKGFQDSRGTLFFEIARIVKAKRPEIVLLENVQGLLNHEKGKTFGVIVQTLGQLGYDVQWMVLNSKFFGVPQNRRRVFLIASLAKAGCPEVLPIGEVSQATPELSGQETNTVKASEGPKSYVIERQQLSKTRKLAQGDRIYQTKGFSRTITSKGGGLGGTTGLYLDKARIRRLTPTECERLQGFPDDWTRFGVDAKGHVVEMSDTQRYRQTGNAVTVNVIEAIARKLAKVR